jgi:hypothetical protein
MTGPRGLAADGDGDVYVADGSQQVEEFGSGGTYLRSFGSYGAGPGQYQLPQGVALDGAGDVFVVDGLGQRVLEYDAGGTFVRSFGRPVIGVDPGVANPSAIAFHGGDLYVASPGNGRIVEYDTTGHFVQIFSLPFRFPPLPLMYAYGVAVDGSGNVYATDQDSRQVDVFGPDGTFLLRFGLPGNGLFNTPYGVGVHGGDLYVDDSGTGLVDHFTITAPDTTPPAVTPPADVVAEATGPTGAAVTFGGATAADDVDGTDPVSCSGPGGLVSGSVFPLGATTVTCTARDAAGNVGSATFTVTVVDTTPPVLTVPGSVSADATGPGGAALSYGTTASDLVDGVIVPVCSPPSGSTFPIGDTAVTCTATDAHGNAATAGFTVHVAGAAEQLAALQAAVAGQGPGRSLADQLAAVQNALAAGDTRAAVGQLGAFGNLVRAQAGKKLTQDQAAAWLAAAERIGAVLGG